MQQHALILSFPMQGHFTPLYHLAHKLSFKGFLFTFVIPQEHNSTTSSRQLLCATHSSSIRTLTVDVDYPCDKNFLNQFHAMEAMQQPVQHLILDIQKQSCPFTCIISDVFVIWSQHVASKFNLPLVAFFTANATSCAILSHASQLVSSGILPFNKTKNRISCFPGVPPLLPSEFPPSMQTQDLSHYRFQFTLRMFEHIHQAAALVVNTFYELERTVIDQLQTKVPIYPIGPLLLSYMPDEASPAQPQFRCWQEEYDCLNWLDAQTPSSVLYASFGTLASFSEAELTELALGLEASRHPFLWAIRPDAISERASKVLPEGFLERTQNRSLIISWAPQHKVLAHPAVCCFLSHCGWNSILENICISAVPMLCWPDAAEQKVNCRLLVDEWKVGMEFEKKEDGFVERAEVERVVRAVMEGEEGERMKSRARELRDLARKAVKEGGSSYMRLDAFVEKMEGLLCLESRNTC